MRIKTEIIEGRGSFIDKEILNSEIIFLLPTQGDEELRSEINNKEGYSVEKILILVPPARGSGPSGEFTFDTLIPFLDFAKNTITIILTLKKAKEALEFLKELNFKSLLKKHGYSNKGPILIPVIVKENCIASFRIPAYLNDSERKNAMSLIGSKAFELKKRRGPKAKNYIFDYDRKTKKYYEY